MLESRDQRLPGLRRCLQFATSPGYEVVPHLGADHLIFEGGGGVGRFRKKISCNPRRKKKKIMQHTIEKKKYAKESVQKKNSYM